MSSERDDFLEKIEELSRKYGVKATEITGNFVIVPVGRKPSKKGCPKNPPKTGS